MPESARKITIEITEKEKDTSEAGMFSAVRNLEKTSVNEKHKNPKVEKANAFVVCVTGSCKSLSFSSAVSSVINNMIKELILRS